LKKLFKIYNDFRRSFIPASKNDLAWSIDELKDRLFIIEQRLGGSPKCLQEYGLAVTKNGYMLTFSNDMIIGKSLRDTGSFQEEDIDRAINLLQQNNYTISREIFLDVGSNIGTHTIYALTHGFQQAICIEADPDNFRLLKINQILNNVDSNCFNICGAASSSSGEAEIELSPSNYGDHRIAISPRMTMNTHEESSWDRKKIKTYTLDKVIELANMQASQISFAWIDTQGHEGHVLSGAEKFLAASIPFVAEFWPYGLERSGGWSQFRQILKDSKRELFDLRRSISTNSLVRVGLEDLDVLYNRWIKEETIQDSPHTDLLIVEKR